TRERYPSGLGRAVFLVLALATGASTIVLIRFAFRLRKHFDFSVYRHTKARNLILERDYARKLFDQRLHNICWSISSKECGEIPSCANPGISVEHTLSTCISST